jgi:ElaB/YqjD/DUF883 family membrane-anchored ribosome-binding protein
MPKWKDIGKRLETETKKAVAKLDENTHDLQHDAKKLGDKVVEKLREIGKKIDHETRDLRDDISDEIRDASKEWSKVMHVMGKKVSEGVKCIKHDDEYRTIANLSKKDCSHSDLKALLEAKQKLTELSEVEIALHNQLLDGTLPLDVNCSEENKQYYTEQTNEYLHKLVNECGIHHDEL